VADQPLCGAKDGKPSVTAQHFRPMRWSPAVTSLPSFKFMKTVLFLRMSQAAAAAIDIYFSPFPGFYLVAETAFYQNVTIL